MNNGYNTKHLYKKINPPSAVRGEVQGKVCRLIANGVNPCSNMGGIMLAGNF